MFLKQAAQNMILWYIYIAKNDKNTTCSFVADTYMNYNSYGMNAQQFSNQGDITSLSQSYKTLLKCCFFVCNVTLIHFWSIWTSSSQLQKFRCSSSFMWYLYTVYCLQMNNSQAHRKALSTILPIMCHNNSNSQHRFLLNSPMTDKWFAMNWECVSLMMYAYFSNVTFNFERLVSQPF